METPPPSSQEMTDRIVGGFFGAGPGNDDPKASRHVWLWAALECAALIPLLFYLRFGFIGGFGWVSTLVFVVYCLIAATGVYARPLAAYRTTVPPRGDWMDRMGAFWLVSCVFGPLLGWALTSAVPLTVGAWRWLYGARVVLAIALPLATALPLTRYVRGRATLLAFPLLVVVTLLPVWSAVNAGRDLWEGPAVLQSGDAGRAELYLAHTEQRLGEAD